MENWYFGGFWFFGWVIFMMLFFGLMSRFWWGGRGRGYWHRDDKDAMQYLKERYAKGEITKAEFEEIKRDLTDKK